MPEKGADMTAVRRQGAGRFATATLTLVLAVAGCGGPADEPGVATARTGTPGPAASATADELARYVEAQRAWVRCLREQGFTDIPDPDANGRVDLSAHGGRKKTDPAWLAAQMACREFQREVPAVLQPTLPPLTAQQLQWRRDYAVCMRANGMPRWPDPKPDGSWPDDQLGGELTEQEQLANDRAIQICDPVITGLPPTTYDPSKRGQG
jgi:hypothetical protein